jgi:hypothetical protein
VFFNAYPKGDAENAQNIKGETQIAKIFKAPFYKKA